MLLLIDQIRASVHLHELTREYTVTFMEHPSTLSVEELGNLDATAQRILSAALKVLADAGVHGTTTRAIADVAGVNEVTLFRRFGTKAELLRLAITHRFQTVMLTSVRFTGDLEGDLVRLASQYRQALETFGPLARVVLSEIAHSPELQSSVKTAQGFYREIAGLFLRYQASGELEREPEWWMVTSFLGPLAMPFVIHEIAPTDVDFPFDAGMYVRRFLDGRRPASAARDQ